MAGKNKGGREAKKPKASAKKKLGGAAPTTIPIVESMNKAKPKK